MPELELIRSPDDKKRFVLEDVGELRKAGSMKEAATLTAADGRAWTADRKGWRRRVVVVDQAGGEPARFEAAGTFKRGGRLTVGDVDYELRSLFALEGALRPRAQWAGARDGGGRWVARQAPGKGHRRGGCKRGRARAPDRLLAGQAVRRRQLYRGDRRSGGGIGAS